jgi:hypothetical protein
VERLLKEKSRVHVEIYIRRKSNHITFVQFRMRFRQQPDMYFDPCWYGSEAELRLEQADVDDQLEAYILQGKYQSEESVKRVSKGT